MALPQLLGDERERTFGDRYRVGRQIGRGAYGECPLSALHDTHHDCAPFQWDIGDVFEGVNTETGHSIAIKMYRSYYDDTSHVEIAALNVCSQQCYLSINVMSIIIQHMLPFSE